jgi:glycosyltransferase involved in cell wall biosynthesis
MRVAFHAPMKPPDHPTPSGDRRIARALMAALRRAGHEVELASRLRSWEGRGDRAAQERIAVAGQREAARLVTGWLQGRTPRPDAWLTYHLYHKAPDWIGPAATRALGIPYLVAEASYAPKQARGPWAFGHAATPLALEAAQVVLAMSDVDAEMLRPLLAPGAELWPFPPFLDAGPLERAAAERDRHRAELAARLGLDPGIPWLLAVAMMRADAKLESYRALAAALARIEQPFELVVVGDGPARGEVEALLTPFGARLTGALDEDELPPVYAASDLLVWPAVREALGMALLEAQAAGVPVVAGGEEGVLAVLDRDTALLVAPRDEAAFAEGVAALLADGDRRRALGRSAALRVRRDHGLAAAAARLDRALAAARRIRRGAS